MLFPIRAFALATALAVSLTACSDKNTASEAKKAEAQTSAAKPSANVPTYKIRIANQPYPPFNIYNAGSGVGGMEVEILAAIAANQNFKVEYDPYLWDMIFKDWEKNHVHMIGGGLAKDDFDLNLVTLSQPYMRSPDCVATTSEDNLANWQKNPLALVNEDENEADMIENFGVLKKNIRLTRSEYQSLQQVLDGKVASTMSDCNVLRYYINKSFPEQKDKILLKELVHPKGDDDYQLVFGVRKDQTELLDKINKGIENLKASGELEKIIQKGL